MVSEAEKEAILARRRRDADEARATDIELRLRSARIFVNVMNVVTTSLMLVGGMLSVTKTRSSAAIALVLSSALLAAAAAILLQTRARSFRRELAKARTLLGAASVNRVVVASPDGRRPLEAQSWILVGLVIAFGIYVLVIPKPLTLTAQMFLNVSATSAATVALPDAGIDDLSDATRASSNGYCAKPRAGGAETFCGFQSIDTCRAYLANSGGFPSADSHECVPGGIAGGSTSWCFKIVNKQVDVCLSSPLDCEKARAKLIIGMVGECHAAIACEAGDPIDLDTRVRTDVGLTGSTYIPGRNVLGYAVGDRARGFVLGEDGRVVARGEVNQSPVPGVRLSRVASLDMGGGLLRAMVDVLEGGSVEEGYRLRCGDVHTSSPVDLVTECRSFAASNSGWIIATHVRQLPNNTVTLVQKLHVGDAAPVELATTTIMPTQPIIADAATAGGNSIEAKHRLHFLEPDSIRVERWIETASIDGFDIVLAEAIGAQARSVRWKLYSEVGPPSLSGASDRVFVAMSRGGDILATSFVPGQAVTKPPQKLELRNAGEKSVGRKVSAAAADGILFLAYIGARDQQVHVSALDDTLQSLISAPMDIADEQVSDVRALPLPGRSLLLAYVTRAGILRSRVVRCGAAP